MIRNQNLVYNKFYHLITVITTSVEKFNIFTKYLLPIKNNPKIQRSLPNKICIMK